MEQVRAIVLRAAGINCDLETEYALRLAGAEPQRIHINRLMAEPALLDGVQILVFPGGFSYGDDVAAGKILANQIMHHLSDMLQRFIEQGKLILGICNGFQVLIKAGLVPAIRCEQQSLAADLAATLTDNDSGRFEDRWVYLQPGTLRCVFIERNAGSICRLLTARARWSRDVSDAGAMGEQGYVAFHMSMPKAIAGRFKSTLTARRMISPR